MTTEARHFYLHSQVFFASVSAIPWVATAIVAVVIVRHAPLFSIFTLGYGAFAAYLLVLWIRQKKDQSVSRAIMVANVALWTVPFLVSISIIGIILTTQFDGMPDTWEGDEFVPASFLPIPVLVAVWFAIPLLFAVLHARMDWRQQ